MSWVVWLFGFGAILVASQFVRFLGHNDRKVSAVLLVGLLSSIGYFFVGRAGLPDQPFDARAAELQARDPLTLSPDEALARFESLVRDQPDAPEPHFLIAEALRSKGQFSDAVRAYQSSLRRDDRFVPAMMGLADVLTQMSGGQLSDNIKQIYARVAVLDQNQIRAGFMVGLADWQAGDEASARARWDAVRDSIPENDPRRQTLASWIDQFDQSFVLPETQTPEPEPEPEAEPEPGPERELEEPDLP